MALIPAIILAILGLAIILPGIQKKIDFFLAYCGQKTGQNFAQHLKKISIFHNISVHILPSAKSGLHGLNSGLNSGYSGLGQDFAQTSGQIFPSGQATSIRLTWNFIW